MRNLQGKLITCGLTAGLGLVSLIGEIKDTVAKEDNEPLKEIQLSSPPYSRYAGNIFFTINEDENVRLNATDEKVRVNFYLAVEIPKNFQLTY